MLFSHISDTHLGLVQYGIEQRENDVYDAFNEAVDISIRDKVDFILITGDIFHTPNPNGNAIIHMANALKRLKENEIEVFFILGEHDISRIRATPIPFVYHNLKFAKYVGLGKPVYFKDVMILGFDKIRKNEIHRFEEKFREVEKIASRHNGHKILMLHQGITDISKYAGEINSSDLPKNFTYYAMGHLHDKLVKEFDGLDGPVVYPGSIETTTSEGIKDVKKGFFEVDISGQNAVPKWIELNTRPQFSVKTTIEDLDKQVQIITDKIVALKKKPLIEIKIHGKEIKTEEVQTRITKIDTNSLYCSLKYFEEDEEHSVLLHRPARIDDELFKLATNALESKDDANFAINELLPLLSKEHIDQATELLFSDYKKFRGQIT